MSNDYFDSYSSLPRDQLARAESVNAIFDAIIVGFNRLPSMASLKEDRVTYATDTGTANAYVIAPTYPILTYTAGQSFRFLAVHANTAASTVNVSSLGVKTIKRPDGNDLASGDITANRLITLQYDGTYFQLVTPAGSDVAASAASATAAASSASAAATSNTASGNSATASAASAAIAAAAVISIAGTVSQWAVAAGTADAITATFPVTVTSLTDGLVLGFRASAANATTTPTFKADGTTAHTITKQGGAALVAGDIKGTLAEYIVRYNLANTRWELLAPSMPYGATTGSGSVVLGTAPTISAPVITGHATIEGVTPTGAIGTGAMVFASALQNYLTGLTLSTAGSSATFSIAAGAAMDSTNTALMILASAYTKTTSAWALGSGNGALDIGTVANSTWYYEWLIQRSDTGVVDVLASLAPGNSLSGATVTIASPGVWTWANHGLQANCPVVFSTTGALPTGLTAGTQYYVKTVSDVNSFTVSATQGGTAINTSGSQSGTHTASANPILPSNYDRKRRIGSMKIDGSAHWVAFLQTGDNFMWVAPVFDANDVTTGSTSAITQTLTVPTGIALVANFNMAVIGSASNSCNTVVTSLSQTDVVPVSGGITFLVTTSQRGSGALSILTNTSAQIRLRFGNTDGEYYIYTMGWIDRRGRDG